MKHNGLRLLVGLLSAVLLISGSVLNAAPAKADYIRDLQYWLTDYGVRDAWQYSKGSGITVAVIDSGIDATHPGLVDAVKGGKDFSGQGNANGTKPVGNQPEHGSLVGSLIAARGEGAENGMIGVAPEASLLSASVAFGTSSNVDEQIAKAIYWAVDNGADIINMSLTRNNPDWPLSWDKAFQYAFAHDVIVVAAAGNRGSGTTMVGAPATIPGVVTVAGVDKNKKASFSASTQGITIAVSAPSEELTGALPGGGYAMWNGTSGAAPIVSGILALMRSAHPNANAEKIIGMLIQTALPAGDDVVYGHGLVQASAAITATRAAKSADPNWLLSEWIRLHRKADSDPIEKPTNLGPSELEPIQLDQIKEPSGWEKTFSSENLRNNLIPIIFFAIFLLAGLVIVVLTALSYSRAKKLE